MRATSLVCCGAGHGLGGREQGSGAAAGVWASGARLSPSPFPTSPQLWPAEAPAPGLCQTWQVGVAGHGVLSFNTSHVLFTGKLSGSLEERCLGTVLTLHCANGRPGRCHRRGLHSPVLEAGGCHPGIGPSPGPFTSPPFQSQTRTEVSLSGARLAAGARSCRRPCQGASRAEARAALGNICPSLAAVPQSFGCAKGLDLRQAHTGRGSRCPRRGAIQAAAPIQQPPTPSGDASRHLRGRRCPAPCSHAVHPQGAVPG